MEICDTTIRYRNLSLTTFNTAQNHKITEILGGWGTSQTFQKTSTELPDFW